MSKSDKPPDQDVYGRAITKFSRIRYCFQQFSSIAISMFKYNSKIMVIKEDMSTSASGSRGRHRSRSSLRPSGENIADDNNVDDVQRGLDILIDYPKNPADRLFIKPINKNQFSGINGTKATKILTTLCLSGWPGPAITWEALDVEYKRLVWETFQKYFQWDASDHNDVERVFNLKCKLRVFDRMNKARGKALELAERDHSGDDVSNFIQDYPPKWVSKDIWGQMVTKWKTDDEKWIQQSMLAVKNRLGSVSAGQKAKGTYQGGSISQSAHYDKLMVETEGKISWIEVYIRTRDGIPDAIKIADDYRRSMNEKYRSGTERPVID